ncbi:MAG TPA: YqiA/YcfP family alpha/beta fold hydrolase [Leptospiraceae bacterium]|nr:YqiA/YcfP family alpha/beta fold hydrolase [Leptospiraceae bacterium]HMW07703.1 YqiA/YcfP family alpha/beta fold hydrolase [Leptospiraceae bacterium]HMX34092.1 YqiA/YcfP family alpha/beta fold hydrolase [Leptospiraceae bacterium]HMY33283.1 YqiA/YcfP family alpha/beta fold hydrolase [Leptospiraceae bacterium]HMZ63020.1 YqiA/YcfP family alpha/beta fold hydrolase [Leptospiraceae bacterium]
MVNSKNVTIYFSHGKESGPNGSKIQRLSKIAEAFGLEVKSIDYTDTMDPEVRADRLIKILSDRKVDSEFILVGSSMGAYVSLVASNQFKPLGVFLLAPAVYIYGFKEQKYPIIENLEIVHGWEDEVIPYELSIRYARESKSVLHLIQGDHRLNSSIETVEGLFRNFLTRTLNR